MENVFSSISVVPSVGNNDAYPHNLMDAGPNQVDIIGLLSLNIKEMA